VLLTSPSFLSSLQTVYSVTGSVFVFSTRRQQGTQTHRNRYKGLACTVSLRHSLTQPLTDAAD